MAKKVRTPPPPRRPVQAPQQRDGKRRAGAQAAGGTAGGRNLLPLVVVLGLVAVAGIAAALFFALRGNGKSSSTSTTASATSNPLNQLPGVRKIRAPWAPEYASLADRLGPLNLSANPTSEAYHIHQHLDIFRDGKRITVPASVGINDGAYGTELHTHDASGIIHVEAPSNKHYTLGSFFAEWGVWLDGKCVGAYCQGYTVYVNGKRQTGEPWNLELKGHQEIAIVIGKPPKKIPSTYPWGGL